ncbi:MAG: RNA polymerase sigma factor [Pseudomonadota bacterium]
MRDILAHELSLSAPKEAEALPPPPLAPSVVPVPVELEKRLVDVVHRYYALVWRTLRRLGTPQADADDATQHVFWTFAGRSAQIEPGREASFLISVAIKVAANARRKLGRRREVGTADEQLVCHESPESLLQQKQRWELLDRGLSTLLPEQRIVFVLFELEGFSLPEIAELNEIPLGTATSRLRRARDHLQIWLREQPNGDEP